MKSAARKSASGLGCVRTGAERWPRRSQDQGAAYRPRWRRARALSCRLWKADRRRNREMGQGNPGGQHQARVIGPSRYFKTSRFANSSRRALSALLVARARQFDRGATAHLPALLIEPLGNREVGGGGSVVVGV